jgi:pyruvate ferredoxin oxidoreductase gamma subunit/2-oxoisovalerate ferredoxin oxidoreductase gamma subunit
MASEILALAAFLEGSYPQSFPSFGLERRGAPVAAYLRIDDERILIRQNIYNPDFVVVMDPTLLELEPTLTGLKKGGGLLINSDDPPDVFRGLPGTGGASIGTVPAGSIARGRGLGTELLPIINTTILGAVARMTQIVSLSRLTDAIEQTIPKKAADNAEGAREAYDRVRVLEAS